MSRIYLIEDERAISDAVAMNLEAVGHSVERAYDGREALDALYEGRRFDLALVDIMLPEVSGAELLEPLSRRGIPVIFLTAVGDVDTKVRSLLGGAEDYVTKPFDMPELLARVAKTLERTGRMEDALEADGVRLRISSRVAEKDGEPLALTPIEFELLLLFLRQPNVALSRERILSDVWGQLYEGETRTVDVHVGQLRRKTGLRIRAVPKVGYRLETTP